MAWDEVLQQAMNLFEELLVAVPAGMPQTLSRFLGVLWDLN